MNETQACVDAEEYAQWQAYDRLYPIGPDRTPHMVAELCAITANLGIAAKHWAPRKDGRPYLPADFLPIYRPPESEEAIEALRIANQEVLEMHMAESKPHPPKA